jgi:hypothetical protein
MARLYGRAGRLTAQNGGFRPGQLNEFRFRDACVAANDANGNACAPQGF